MALVALAPILNIWLAGYENKVEILTSLYVTERSNLGDSGNYGGSEGGHRGGSSFGRTGGGQGRFGGPRPFRPSPVRVGEEYDVTIESMSKRGDSGVARVQGLVIFVVGTKVGDGVKVKITKVGRGYATAEIAGHGTTAGGPTEVPAESKAELGETE
jgi:predicted RNA-binding protein with TRAM domain